MKKSVQNRISLLKIGIVCVLSLFMLHIQQTDCRAAKEKQRPGRFNLVSVGVGDPDLITLRAINTIKASDIIICRSRTREAFGKYLEDKTFWEGAFQEWRTHEQDCGTIPDPEKRKKCKSDKAVREKLAARIRAAVNAGKTVSVLGSGDLQIYGGPYRWYRNALEDLDIRVVPGVSCLNAANAALGDDLMTGDGVRSAVLTHYHGIDKLAKDRPTMVIFTMHTAFSDIVDKLKTYYPPETPIAIVFYAGYKDKEHQIKGRLDNILDKTRDVDFPFEHLVYVGSFMK